MKDQKYFKDKLGKIVEQVKSLESEMIEQLPKGMNPANITIPMKSLMDNIRLVSTVSIMVAAKHCPDTSDPAKEKP